MGETAVPLRFFSVSPIYLLLAFRSTSFFVSPCVALAFEEGVGVGELSPANKLVDAASTRMLPHSSGTIKLVFRLFTKTG